LTLKLPPGWRGWIYTHSAPWAIVQVANFPMRWAHGYDDGASRARKHLKPGNILIVLLEVEPHGGYAPPRIHPPLTIRNSDFGAVMESVGAGVPFARRSFSLRGRQFDLWVQFGGDAVRADLLDETNEVLGTLRVGKPRGYLQIAAG